MLPACGKRLIHCVSKTLSAFFSNLHFCPNGLQPKISTLQSTYNKKEKFLKIRELTDQYYHDAINQKL